MGVNVAPDLVADRTLPGRVRATLTRHRLAPDRLALEITETGLLVDLETVGEVIRALRGLGVRLALDDFGVGYSSLAHLHRVPLDALKLDGSFLLGLGEGGEQERYARALLRLGEDLGLDVIAEGVEEPEQRDALLALGCRYAQGFLLGRPMPAEELTALLRKPVSVP
jgi:EAL domain-containing protein (putative c-di-GMP-specific phosphodiesterase class I)